MTEEDAKLKWCPWARVTVFGRIEPDEGGRAVAVVAQGSNRIVCTEANINSNISAAIENHGWTRCSGSKCMAWRWLINGSDGSDGSDGCCGMIR